MKVLREQLTIPTGKVELVTLFSIQPFENNVYVLADPESADCLVIDASEARPILDAVKDRVVKAVLVTHGHRDHHQQLPLVRQALPDVPVGIGAQDAAMLDSPPTFTIPDGEVLTFGRHQLRAITTPGHTSGGVSFLLGDVVFSGDTLFPGGPGNTTNPYGNFEQIIESIRDRLFTLPDDTRVMPGHGMPTTIGAERPHLDEWIARGW